MGSRDEKRIHQFLTDKMNHTLHPNKKTKKRDTHETITFLSLTLRNVKIHHERPRDQHDYALILDLYPSSSKYNLSFLLQYLGVTGCQTHVKQNQISRIYQWWYYISNLFSNWNLGLFFHIVPGDLKSDNMSFPVCRSIYFMFYIYNLSHR